MTLLEILVTVILVGLIVPSLTVSLSRQTEQRRKNTARELAVIYAEEGVELLINGGYRHWRDKVRAPGLPSPPTPYSYSPAPPVSSNQPIQVTVAAFAAASDDPFNPFIGDIGLLPTNPMTIKPWSQFRRNYVLYSDGRPTSEPSRVLRGTVNVWYGPDATNDVISVPLYVSNHPVDSNLRRLLFMPTNPSYATLATLDTHPALQVSLPLGVWGSRGDNSLSVLYDSIYPWGDRFPDCQ
ncbi:MAG: type II secretion system protein [Candidatus Riflebacteria bacterium]|nr:type II secretion system protein [Candidatus Riflebacteria bacterium]